MQQWKKDDIIDYEPDKKDFIQEMKENPETCTFNVVEDHQNNSQLKYDCDVQDDYMLNEAHLALYKVNKLGGLKRLED